MYRFFYLEYNLECVTFFKLLIQMFRARKEQKDFIERSKTLAGYKKVILLTYQNNYVERSN